MRHAFGALGARVMPLAETGEHDSARCTVRWPCCCWEPRNPTPRYQHHRAINFKRPFMAHRGAGVP